MLGPNQQKHQQRRERRQDNRQDRRDRRFGRRMQNTPATPTTTQPAATSANPADYTYEPLPVNPAAGTAMPSGNLTNPFFDPASNYISPGTQGNVVNFFDTAGQPGSTMGNIYGTEESPEGYYYAVLNQRGLGGFDARSRAAQSMYGDYARGYQSAKMMNSELWFPQYMGMQDIPSMIQMLSDEQLGINREQFNGPVNWTLRG